MHRSLEAVFLLALFAISGCATDRAAKTSRPTEGSTTMNDIATSYVKLVLAVGQHDSDYVDAYYGPPEWRQEAEARKLSLTEIASRAATLGGELASAAPAPDADEM